jgi:hypothetical protein
MKKLALWTATVAMLAAGLAPAAAADTPRQVLFVDDDRAQCPNAGYTTIQAAVNSAQPGDQVNVCAGTYPEQVVVDKPLTLLGDPDTVAATDCFTAPTPPALPVIAPAAGGFTVAVRLGADDITLAGLDIRAASVGVDASDSHSGYRVDHNVIENNTLFAMDFGSNGGQLSRVDHDCVRNNHYGVVSELTDDSAWPAPPLGTDRGAYARDLANARLDHNDTTNNLSGLEAAGPGTRNDVTFDDNHSIADQVGIASERDPELHRRQSINGWRHRYRRSESQPCHHGQSGAQPSRGDQHPARRLHRSVPRTQPRRHRGRQRRALHRQRRNLRPSRQPGRLANRGEYQQQQLRHRDLAGQRRGYRTG